MTAATIIERTRQYITENFLYMRPDVVLAENDSLLGQGIIDSMGVTELLTFIEDEFGVAASDDEITEQNLGTLRAIGAFVSARAAGAAKVA